MGWDVHVLRTCAHELDFHVFDVTEQVGLGWGGVGLFTFLEHAHMSLTSMFDVTEQYVHRGQWR